MPDPPLLVAMSGIPFSGKSTVARELAARCGMALVSVDAIVGELGLDLGADADNHRGWARAMAEGFARSRRLLAEGTSVIYDNANHTRRNRDRCRRVATRTGATFRLVWVDTPLDEARRRLLANRRDARRGDVPDAAFREIVAQFEPPLNEPGVIRFWPEMGGETLVHELSLASSRSRLSERSEESPGEAAAPSADARNGRAEKDAPASLPRASRGNASTSSE